MLEEKTKVLHAFCLLLIVQNVKSFNHTIICPKAFRLGAEERVVLNLHGYEAATINAKLQEPSGENFFSETPNLVLDQETASRPINLHVMVKDTDLSKMREIQKVLLVISVSNSNGGNFEKKMEVLVSKQGGYIFVATDRPIYKPGDRVYVKVYRMDQVIRRHFEPVEILIKNPQGIAVHRVIKGLPRGIDFVESSYDVEAYPDSGLWTVQVWYYENNYETATETTFQVQRYSIPTFRVSVEVPHNFVQAYREFIEATIKATYSHGGGVNGHLQVSMKLRTPPDSPTPVVFYRIPEPDLFGAVIRDGEYQIRISQREIGNQRGRNFSENIVRDVINNGGSVFIEASVTESTSGRMESVISRDFPIVNSPYLVDTSQSSSYFTPGLPYRLKVVVRFVVDRNSAIGVPYELIVNDIQVNSGRTNNAGQVEYEHSSFDNDADQIIVIRITGLNGTESTFVLQSYESSSQSYLQLYADNKQWRVGEELELKFQFNRGNVADIRFLVVSRGTIVYSDVKYPRRGANESTAFFRILQKMVPSARIVAYYFVENEVVSNSLWLDVENICKLELDILSNEDIINSGLKTPVTISLKGPQNAIVSVNGIDRASYFLYNQSRLTSEAMFERMEKYQQGCDRNGGSDASNVFWEAGLTLSSGEYDKQEVFNLNCHQPLPLKRKRRDILDEFSFENEDCVNNQVINLLSGESCSESKYRCLEENGLNEACCKELESQCLILKYQEKTTERKQQLHRVIRNSDFSRGASFQTRSDFSQNIVFTDTKIEYDGFLDIIVPSSQSITTFEISAVSIQHNFQEDSFCIAEPQELRFFKDVFLQLFAPYSLQKHKQENLVITAFNYRTTSINVAIDVRSSDILRTRFSSREWSTLLNVEINSQGSASTIFTVLPLRLPDNNGSMISVEFRVRNSNGMILDRIEKDLLIEEEGEFVEKKYQSKIELLHDREQEFILNFPNFDSIIPGSLQCWAYAYSSPSASSFQVEPLNEQLQLQQIERLFRDPFGDGEANLIISSVNVFAHMYLNATETFDVRSVAYNESVRRLVAGYAQQLVHRSNNDQMVFSVFSSQPPSTWLNAFAVKVFVRASSYVQDAFDRTPLCTSLEWLLSQQESNGEFVERGRVFRSEMQGAVGTNLTLTTYAVISLLETNGSCNRLLNRRITVAVSRAMSYLMQSENSTVLTRPYPLSLFAYALALHQPTSAATERVLERLILQRITERQRTHWEVAPLLNETSDILDRWYLRMPAVLNIETTAYGLLALTERAKSTKLPSSTAVAISRKVAHWLLQQNFTRSIQAVVMQLQALANFEEWIAESQRQISTNFSIELSASGTIWENPIQPQFHLLEENLNLTTNRIPIPSDVVNFGIANATATGYGEGILEYKCVYRVEDNRRCSFVVNQSIEEVNRDAADENLLIKMTVYVAPVDNEVNRTVVEIGLLPGFLPTERSVLRFLVGNEAIDGQVDFYQITDVSIIYHLRNLTSDGLTLAFDAVQTTIVEQTQPAKIKIYDAAEPSNGCDKFYSLPFQRSQILTAGCSSSS